ncbi:MAG TPA: hypothetical protein VGB13_04850 [Candidatus Krumholzibacteria bacterium]|jgi:tetratricopeptide (TPR) repeat protein
MRKLPSKRERSLFLFGLAGLLVACGGGGSVDRREELQGLLDAEQYGEILARTELYLDADEEDAFIYFARGVALVRGQNADVPAKTALAEAALRDSTLLPSIAQEWRVAALADAEAGWKERAARRMREGFRYDQGIVLHPVADRVGDLLYRYEERWEDALVVYSRLVREGEAGMEKRQEWQFRYGHCLERVGDIEGGLATYEEFFKLWPEDSIFQRYAKWRYLLAHIELAKAALAEKRLDDALERISLSFEGEWDGDLQQRARLVAGSIYEARLEYELALQSYEKILQEAGHQGEWIAEAKNRIDALNAQGVY